MALEIKILTPAEQSSLKNVAEDVFDHRVNSEWCAEFLNDPRHHLAVAIDEGLVVGMASAVHYIHPDKAPELWINEVGVASSHRERGVGKKLLRALFAVGKQLGCSGSWVLTDKSNTAARRLYESIHGKETAGTPVVYEFNLARGEES